MWNWSILQIIHHWEWHRFFGDILQIICHHSLIKLIVIILYLILILKNITYLYNLLGIVQTSVKYYNCESMQKSQMEKRGTRTKTWLQIPVLQFICDSWCLFLFLSIFIHKLYQLSSKAIINIENYLCIILSIVSRHIAN